MRIYQVVFSVFFFGLSLFGSAAHAIPIDICSPEEIETILIDDPQTRQDFFLQLNGIMQDQVRHVYADLLDRVLNQIMPRSAKIRAPFSAGKEHYRFFEKTRWLSMENIQNTQQFKFESTQFAFGWLTGASGKTYTLKVGFRTEVEQDQEAFVQGRSQKPFRVSDNSQCEIFFRTFLSLYVYNESDHQVGVLDHSDSYTVQQRNTIDSFIDLRYKLTFNRDQGRTFEEFRSPRIRLKNSVDQSIQEIAEIKQ